ncbi:LuxR family transcriptional regulator [Streptomyces sp. NPDC051576]|uniref:helix-turn-helix transcriptional regulator n=1 Tax=Streptomyces sp. NPDC051576 TaxID=3155803 RepID=UPI00341DB792
MSKAFGSELRGRDHELAVLTSTLRRPTAHLPKPLLITGPWGSGKSTLLRAAEAQAATMGIPLMSLADGPGDAGEPGQAEADARTRPVENLLDGPGELRIVLVDDLHRLDDATLKSLDALRSRSDRKRVLLVATMTDGSHGAYRPRVRSLTAGARRLWLRNLPIDVIHAMLQERYESGIDRTLAVTCAEATDGNPLLVSQVINHLAEGISPTCDAIDGGRRAMLVHRIRLLLAVEPDHVSGFAEALSVLGGRGRLTDVAALAGMAPDDATHAAQRLRRMGVLRPCTQLELSPLALAGLIRDATAVERLDLLHHRAARRLSLIGAPIEEVAAHITETTSPDVSWLTERLREAARAVTARGASRTAARHLRNGLMRCEPGSEPHTTLLTELAVAEQDFDLRSALRHLSQIVPPPTEAVDLRVRFFRRFSPLLLSSATSTVQDSLHATMLDLGDPALLTGRQREEALRIQARWCFTTNGATSTPVGAESWPTDACRSSEGRTPAERALMSVLLHRATLTVGRPAHEVMSLAGNLLQAERDSVSPHDEAFLLMPALALAGAPQQVLNRLAAVGDRLPTQEEASVGTTGERPARHAWLSAAEALATLCQGLLPEAVALASRSLALGGEDWRHHGRDLVFIMARIAVESRNAELCDQFLDLPEYARDRAWAAAAHHLVRGYKEFGRGNDVTALHHFQNCGYKLEGLGVSNPEYLSWRSMSTACLIRMGRKFEARAIAEELYDISASWGSPTSVGVALRELAWTSEGKQAIDLMNQSVEALSGSVNRLELAKSHYSLARHLESPAAAKAHMRRARSIARSCGVEWDGECDDTGSFHVQLAPVAVPLGLTTAEIEVARLAASGKSNLEISERVGVTVRSVERRLSKVYAKLRIQSRSQLLDLLDDPAARLRV